MSLKNIFSSIKTSPRVKGSLGLFLAATVVLFSYQNCIKPSEKSAVMKETLNAPPINVFIDIASLADCFDGGVSITTYLDSNINGKLDSDEIIKNTRNICNGAKGSNGVNGLNGQNGTNGIDGKNGGLLVGAAPTGTCSAGGILVTTFVDNNNNGVLDHDEQITSKSSVCNGADGINGESSQITVTRATSAQCFKGGVVYTTSTDSSEPLSTVICNGLDGANGINASIAQAVASPLQCPTGGTVITTSTGNSEPVFSIICNGAKGETGNNGAAGQNAYVTTSVANPFQCSTGGVVISTWTDAVNPQTQVICNGVNGTNGTNGSNAYITTQAASTAQCSNGGFVITTSTDKTSPVANIVCNGAAGANGTDGTNGSNGNSDHLELSYLTGYVGPLVSGKNYSACHHDFMFFPGKGSSSNGWLVFRHQRNGSEDQGIGTTGFNVWNVDISNFALVSEVGNITYCNLTYDFKAETLQYTVVDKTDGLAGKTGTINLKNEKRSLE